MGGYSSSETVEPHQGGRSHAQGAGLVIVLWEVQVALIGSHKLGHPWHPKERFCLWISHPPRGGSSKRDGLAVPIDLLLPGPWGPGALGPCRLRSQKSWKSGNAGQKYLGNGNPSPTAERGGSPNRIPFGLVLSTSD